jgi:hypothetical protein
MLIVVSNQIAQRASNGIRQDGRLLAVLALCLLLVGCGSVKNSRAPKSQNPRSNVDVGLAEPMAVAISPDGTRAWCSNLGEAGSYSGFISEIGLDGSVRIRNAFPRPEDPRLQEPKGLVVNGDHLWVIAHQQLVEYNIRSRRQERSLDLAYAGLVEGYALAPIGMVDPKTNEYDLVGFEISDQTQDGILSVRLENEKLDHASWDVSPKSGPSGIGGVLFLFPSFDIIISESNNQCIRMANMVGGFTLSDSIILHFPKKPWIAVAVKNERLISAAADGTMWILESTKEAYPIPVKLDHPGMFCIAPNGLFALVPEQMLNRIVVVPLPHG